MGSNGFISITFLPNLEIMVNHLAKTIQDLLREQMAHQKHWLLSENVYQDRKSANIPYWTGDISSSESRAITKRTPVTVGHERDLVNLDSIEHQSIYGLLCTHTMQGVHQV